MIIRVHKTRDFKTVSCVPFEDSRLSYKARGIIGYCLVKPDAWDITVADLIAKSDPDGRDSINAGIEELIRHGYMRRKRETDSSGKVIKWSLDLYEKPQQEKPEVENPHVGKPQSGFPEVEKPEVENPHQTNIQAKQKYITTKNTGGEIEKISPDDEKEGKGPIEPAPLDAEKKESPPHTPPRPPADPPTDNAAKKAAAKKKAPAISPEAAGCFPHFTDAAEIAEVWADWLGLKVSQYGAAEWYKAPETEKTALRKLFKLSGGDSAKARDIVAQSIAAPWKGLFQLKEEHASNISTTNAPRFASKSAQQHADIANHILAQRRQQFADLYEGEMGGNGQERPV